MATSKTKKAPIDKEKQRRIELRKAVRSAAFEFCEKGTYGPLAKKCGCTGSAIISAIQRGKFSPLLAIALEASVGRKILTREFLCPEIFDPDNA